MAINLPYATVNPVGLRNVRIFLYQVIVSLASLHTARMVVLCSKLEVVGMPDKLLYAAKMFSR